MGSVDVTGFERRRREQREAEHKAKLNEAVNVYAEEENAAQGENELIDDELGKPVSPEDVDGMEIEDVKGFLDAAGVKYSHNTGEAKLREKLKNAIG